MSSLVSMPSAYAYHIGDVNVFRIGEYAKDIGMKEAYERLQWAREQHFEYAADAARALGVNLQTYYSHENGGNGFSKNAVQYARKFGVTVQWLLYGQGDPNKEAPVQQTFDGLPPDAQQRVRNFMDFELSKLEKEDRK